VAEQAALIETLRAEVAALRRQANRDSSSSSQPPSQDSPAAEAKKKAGQREARRARPGRPQGGQKGHPGASLAWTAWPEAPVSTGFVSRCLVRLDAALTAAGFEDALKDALRASEVPPCAAASSPSPARPVRHAGTLILRLPPGHDLLAEARLRPSPRCPDHPARTAPARNLEPADPARHPGIRPARAPERDPRRPLNA
jgi:hypothetical protein